MKDCKYPVGNGVNAPELHKGQTTLIRPTQPDSLNGGASSETTASTENLAAKFKYPSKTVDASPELLNEYK